jgi:hypothetical protein
MFVIMCGNYLRWTLAVDSPTTLELLQAAHLDANSDGAMHFV